MFRMYLLICFVLQICYFHQRTCRAIFSLFSVLFNESAGLDLKKKKKENIYIYFYIGQQQPYWCISE